MAHHKSALKRIRQTETKRVHNKYYARTTRNAISKLRNETNKEEAEKSFPSVASMIDKLAKHNIIHKNKAANLKSGLALHISKL
ncbi:MAG: 30S ribosomal protein S20 [Prolixibacteraceae bacterium]|nr:30S ribosomal protein S20 [Prolixibacteraceae bacterium]MBN2775022.1 30S ribosomal protein S20 [Prolixibacteraceae bacterium]